MNEAESGGGERIVVGRAAEAQGRVPKSAAARQIVRARKASSTAWIIGRCDLRPLAAVLLLTLSSPCCAHTIWGNGEPVPDWVRRSCCGPADAHRLRPDQVHRVADGFMIDGYPREIFDAQVAPSEDGEFWAFYSEYTASDGSRNFTSVYCFFAPAQG